MPLEAETLYKYGKLSEHSRGLFATPTVWFSSAPTLNDPFELRPWLTFEGSDEQIVEFLTKQIRRSEPGTSLMNALSEGLRIFREGRHKNPDTWNRIRQDVIESIARDVGIFCMSTIADSILMWSHYACNHEGYCLEFAATDETPFFGEALEVKYDSRFPTIDFFKTSNEEQVDLIFLTKYEGWKYEHEYRIIDHQQGHGLHAYPEELLLSVTFGLRMSKLDQYLIRQWLSHRSYPVALYQASIDQRELRVVRTRIA